MPLSPALLAAYENADYVVFADPELVLRVGEPSSRLDALLEQQGASTAVYLTAANAGAVSTLKELVAAAGYPSHAGEGRDPDGDRDAEQSLLVIGIYRANAEALGRLFGQNAIV